MKLTAIVTCHESDPNPVVRMLKAQTRPPDEILLETSGECEPLTEDVNFHVHAHDEKDYGYRKRNRMALRASGEWLGFFCHDESYHPRYIELMLRKAETKPEADVVYCAWSYDPSCTFRPAESSLGNFFIKTRVFTKAGGFEIAEEPGMCDALLIYKLAFEMGVKSVKEPATLYYHNVPFEPTIVPTNWGQPVRVVTNDYKFWTTVTDMQIPDDPLDKEGTDVV